MKRKGKIKVCSLKKMHEWKMASINLGLLRLRNTLLHTWSTPIWNRLPHVAMNWIYRFFILFRAIFACEYSIVRKNRVSLFLHLITALFLSFFISPEALQEELQFLGKEDSQLYWKFQKCIVSTLGITKVRLWERCSSCKLH